MKKSLVLYAILFAAVMAVSCKKTFNDFLNKAPGVDVNEDIIFSSRVNVEAEISTMYYFGMVSIFSQRDGNINSSPTGATPVIHGTLAGATDEAENEANFVYLIRWNTAAIIPANVIAQEDNRYFGRWKAIRYANILLERIGGVPDPLADAAFKTQARGEAMFIRALSHFETLKRYGGIPLINKRFNSVDEAKVPRSSFEECVNFIAKDCDSAVAYLPFTYIISQRGRATKLAALALKSRLLLYAASPLFNTATPYLPMANAADNKLICYGNFDANRWKLAADAAKAVLDAAALSSAALIDVPANRDPVNLLNGNYRVSWELQDNSEVIIADKSYARLNRFNWPWYHLIPTPMGSFWVSNSATHTFVQRYEKKDGGLQTWNPAGGDDLVDKYNQLDPRFKQTIGFNGGRWNNEHPLIETFTGGKHAANCFGGAWVVKHVPEALANGGSAVPGIALFRLNEFYLNYAEALNEFSGPSTETYTAINTIRTRSGMPNTTAGLSKDAFRAKVRNERAIELSFEDHRFWDLRRWMVADIDGFGMKGPVEGIRITKLAGTAFRYVPYVIETRTFNRNMYLHPYDENEVLKSAGLLIQNPGW